MFNSKNKEQDLKNHPLRVLFIAVVLIGVGILSLVGYKNPELFQASISGGGGDDPTVTTHFYIPNTYVSPAGETDYIHVRAGRDFTDITEFKLTLVAPSDQLSFISIDTSSFAFDGIAMTGSPSGNKYLIEAVQPFSTGAVADNDILFRLLVSVDQGLSDGTDIVITADTVNINDSVVTDDGTQQTVTFRNGQISVSDATLCENLSCGSHGACNQFTGVCECNDAYDGLTCNQCGAGYTGYPNCVLDVFSNLTSLVLSLDQVTTNNLDTASREEVFASAILMINSSQANGHSINIEGQTVPVIFAGTYVDEITTIDEIVNDATFGLANTLQVQSGGNPLITVTPSPTAPGVIVLRPTSHNTNNSIEITTTDQTGAISIIPGISRGLTMTPNDSYGMQVVGVFSDGTTQSLNLLDVEWMAQPLSRLKDQALDAGRLEAADDASGTADVFVEIEKADTSFVRSNTITVTIPSGPVIEYARLIGGGPITRGDRANISVKVNDVNQISDIASITSSIVRTNFATYEEIVLDPNAVYFTLSPYSPSELAGMNGSADEGQEGDSFFRIYSIPVEIPQDNNLTDGAYQLLIEITDASGNNANAVLPITIGAAASGDINGDGQTTMLDVILSFQFAVGAQTPTVNQRLSADVDGSGDVTMLDVILLFNQVNQ